MPATLSQPISDITIEYVQDTFEISYTHNGEPKSHQFTEWNIIKLLKRFDMITGHQTYSGEFLVLTDTNKETLEDFMLYTVNKMDLINQIEKL
jgi:hypothetical protein